MNTLKLYHVSNDYINYLIQYETKVLSNKEEDMIKGRKYLGVVLKNNGFNYFVPLSSPKDSDYIRKDGVKKIRKSIVPIMRIVSTDVRGKDELKGTLKFNNMIPVPDCALLDYDVNSEPDEDYKILLTKEIRFISANKNKIIKNANIIHNQKMNGYNINYLKQTVDFELLEKKCNDYEKL